MNIKSNQYYPAILQWLRDNLNSEEVKGKLNQIGLDNETQIALYKEFQKLRNEKRLQQGILFIIIGAVIGFISCVLTITNPFPGLYNIILFGLTSMAIIVAFVGIYLIFE